MDNIDDYDNGLYKTESGAYTSTDEGLEKARNEIINGAIELKETFDILLKKENHKANYNFKLEKLFKYVVNKIKTIL